jgi:hypothetical protein
MKSRMAWPGAGFLALREMEPCVSPRNSVASKSSANAGGVVKWEPLRGNSDMACASGTICRFEYFLEVYSEQAADPHPGLNAAERIRFRRLKIRNSSGWVPLIPLNIPTSFKDTPPYITCSPAGSTDPAAFDARRASAC